MHKKDGGRSEDVRPPSEASGNPENSQTNPLILTLDFQPGLQGLAGRHFIDYDRLLNKSERTFLGHG
jgi:hypothetical protein